MNEKRDTDVLEIDLEELFGIIMHRLWLILLGAIAAGTAAFAVSCFVVVPQYESTTGIYIMNKQENASLSYTDTQLASQLTKDYEELITCRYVLEKVVKECGLEEDYEKMRDRVTVENAADTRILYITVRDTDPRMAQYIADSIREAASEHIQTVTNVEAVNVVDKANLPLEPAFPNIPVWTLIGAFLGLLVCMAVVVVRYILDDTIKTSEDVEKYLEWSTLALIPVMEKESESGKKNKVIYRKSVPGQIETEDGVELISIDAK